MRTRGILGKGAIARLKIARSQGTSANTQINTEPYSTFRCPICFVQAPDTCEACEELSAKSPRTQISVVKAALFNSRIDLTKPFAMALAP